MNLGGSHRGYLAGRTTEAGMERLTNLAMTTHCALSAARRGASLVLRLANRVSSSSTATPCVKGIIGQNTKKNANNMLKSYAMRRCSRTHRPRRTVPFASCQSR